MQQAYRDVRNIGSLDNSGEDTKRTLREEFMGKVEATLCFDLFCGHGLYCRELYRDRFATVVCVDKKADALADLPQDEHVNPYIGDNGRLVMGLIERYGWPDFMDLDAYGTPDAPLVKALKMAPDKARFAVVATDGTFLGRKRNNKVPQHWGHGSGIRWAPFAAGRNDYPLIVRDNLTRWLEAAGYALAEFEAHLPRGQSVVYWAALATKLEATGAAFPGGG